MNCSRSCLRRLLGILSLGMANRSRRGTWSPISCISPSTIHHSDFSSFFLSGGEWDLLRRLGWPASVLKNWRRGAPLRSDGTAELRRLATESIAVFSGSWGKWLSERAVASEVRERAETTYLGVYDLRMKPVSHITRTNIFGLVWNYQTETNLSIS